MLVRTASLRLRMRRAPSNPTGLRLRLKLRCFRHGSHYGFLCPQLILSTAKLNLHRFPPALCNLLASLGISHCHKEACSWT
jgi:hypothetical protein